MNSIVQKPWGFYKVIEESANYLVKIIVVKPQEKLSLQSHKYRSEHWIVVQGIATVTIDKFIKKLISNESIYIPKKAKHRLENNNKNDLKIIEVQYGTDLREDDIIRYEDIYDRK